MLIFPASNGIRALLLVVSSALLGVGYFLYLNAEPFPPGIVRLVPIAWFTAAVLAAVRAVRALITGSNKAVAVLAVILDIPNSVFAALFTMAALMGD
jgi:hypothetical protein